MALKETCGMASCSARRVRLGDLKEHQSVRGKVELKVFFGVKTFWKSMHMAGLGVFLEDAKTMPRAQNFCVNINIF